MGNGLIRRIAGGIKSCHLHRQSDMNTKSVLLVEDDPTTARIYKSLFERSGYEVTVSPDGSDAFMEAHNRHYAILLLDLMLPNMDGLAMLRRFRAQKRFNHTPIFLFTSSELSQVQTLAMEAGATRIFSKTAPAKEIVQAILDAAGTVPQSSANVPQEASETDHYRSPDFRVPGQTDSPKLTLRMAEESSKKEPPLVPREAPPKSEIKVNLDPPKKGLLSRIFKQKPEDS